MAKEQESKRELQAVQAELVKTEARGTVCLWLPFCLHPWEAYVFPLGYWRVGKRIILL